MTEQWKPINSNNAYEISNFGNVRKTDTKKNINPIQMNNGCYKVNLYYAPKSYHQHTMAKLVAEHFLENYDPHKNTKHKDKNKSNYRIDNLIH